ncbi:MAG: hypothetical protein Q4D85_02030 [Corynebacterium sp.]|uniref:hypothetical protein n=1 Tax=Corynebacterium sp. TaxID=1720 RepID=UPI0026DC81E1|nr:hypothetical protein [Corynebacterium sp.]MDO5097508.1 hypothetical protein [Corynebacterium sp.]
MKNLPFNPQALTAIATVLGLIISVLSLASMGLSIGFTGSSQPQQYEPNLKPQGNVKVTPLKPGETVNVSQGDTVFTASTNKFGICTLGYVNPASRTGVYPAHCTAQFPVGSLVYLNPKGTKNAIEIGTFTGANANYRPFGGQTADNNANNLAYISFNDSVTFTAQPNRHSGDTIRTSAPEEGTRACVLLTSANTTECGSIIYTKFGDHPVIALDDAPAGEAGGPVWTETSEMLGLATLPVAGNRFTPENAIEPFSGYLVTTLSHAYDRDRTDLPFR